jgi:zinc D-Ala-D-Ala carboxypeptidase
VQLFLGLGAVVALIGAVAAWASAPSKPPAKTPDTDPDPDPEPPKTELVMPTPPTSPRLQSPPRWRGRFFAPREMIVSSKAAELGLSNLPAAEDWARLDDLVVELLDKVREGLGVPVTVNSGFRTPEVNRAIGGSPTSDHMLGAAADIVSPRAASSSRELARRIVPLLEQLGVQWDQVIWYDHKPHVHVSWRRDRARRQILRAKADGSYPAQRP